MDRSVREKRVTVGNLAYFELEGAKAVGVAGRERLVAMLFWY